MATIKDMELAKSTASTSTFNCFLIDEIRSREHDNLRIGSQKKIGEKAALKLFLRPNTRPEGKRENRVQNLSPGVLGTKKGLKSNKKWLLGTIDAVER